MRGIRRGLGAVLLSLALCGAAIPAAGAASRTLDHYCGPSGDFCTFVIKKDSGTIFFEIRAFADYFGRSQACVKKDTRVCHSRRPHRDHHVFVWRIQWQGNYPHEGAGEYAVRWINESGSRIGPVLHFERR